MGQAYSVAVGLWGIQPSEFWGMTPREWWLVCDSRTMQANAKIDAMTPGPKFSKKERAAMQAMHDKAMSNGAGDTRKDNGGQ